MLTPVENPRAYGLVETDARRQRPAVPREAGRDEITCNTINAGIYVLEPETFDRIPKDTAWSIERSFFPSLIERGETFVAYVYDGYWIDIGTPAKYLQVHRDIMDGRYSGAAVRAARDRGRGSRRRRAGRGGRRAAGPCFVDEGAVVKAGRASALLGHRPADARRGRPSSTARSSGRTAGSAARRDRGSILGRNCHIGRNAVARRGAVLGDKTVITDYSKL